MQRRRLGLIPGLGRFPWGRNRQPGILAWEVPWAEKPDGLQSVARHKVLDAAELLNNNSNNNVGQKPANNSLRSFFEDLSSAFSQKQLQEEEKASTKMVKPLSVFLSELF